MKACPLVFISLLSALPLAAQTTAPDGNSQFRQWRDQQGRTVEATFRGVESGTVYLQTRDGRMFSFPVSNLTPEDQEIAKTLKPEGLGIQKNIGLAQSAAIIDKGVLMGLQKAGQKPNALASDEQFIRRVYLDLAGRIPTRQETLDFLADTSAAKRATMIDALVNSDGFTSHMYNYFSDMLRVSDDAQKAKFYSYQEWLKSQLAANRPWNEMVRDMMVADGKMLENGAAGYLLRDRGMRLDNLSLTLSTFLGADVSCAQCHDHPFTDWTQRQFYEMASFFGASETYNRSQPRRMLREMRGELTQQDFQIARRLFDVNSLSITDGKKGDVTLPDDYKYKDGKPGDLVKPKLIVWTKDDHRLRAYQDAERIMKKTEDESHLREVFANWMTSPDNPRFAKTIANRLWKQLFGVGIKEPVTDLDDLSAASNPELLQHLGNEMVRLKFDIRSFMRLLCNTQTYQREAVTRELALGEPYYFPGPILRRMTAEQAWDSCVTLAIGDKVDHFKLKRAASYKDVMMVDAANIKPNQLVEKITEVRNTRRQMDSAIGGGGKNKNNAKQRARMAKMMQENASDEGGYNVPTFMEGLALARASELRQPERDSHFLRMFGQSDRQIADSNSSEGSIPQILMLMNGEAQNVLQNPRSLVLANAMGEAETAKKVESLYYSFFSRKPTAEEITTASEAFEAGLTSSDLCWVLFNAREFVFVQ